MLDQTNSAFAWSSPERALQFAKALSEVVIRHRPVETPEREEQGEETDRLRAVLRVLLDFSPVQAASLWKIKARAKRASCIADTRPGEVPTDAGICGPGEAFVCELNRPPIVDALDAYSSKVNAGSDRDWVIVQGASERLYIPFGRLCGPPHAGDLLPNYLVELYASSPPTGEPLWGVPFDVIEAIKSKLTSGICALIDRRLTRITREMSNVTVSDANAGADYAIDKAILKVIPHFIRCQRVIRLSQAVGGDYRVAQDQMVLPEESRSQSPLHDRAALSEDARIELVGIIEKAFAHAAKGAGNTVLLFEPDLRSSLTDPVFSDFRNIMVARLDSAPEGSAHTDYLVLVNRLNDLAPQCGEGCEVDDYFDWEDEVYLSHMALVIGFIRELFSAEEVRIRRAHIIAHEMHAPTGFIYATVERILDSVEGRRVMPDAMVRRELNDILITNDLQTALLNNLMLGLDVTNQAPCEKYVPELISMRDVADTITRMVLPICRKNGVSQAGIVMRHLPSIWMDRRALTQVFLNLTTNAIKYSSPKTDFQLLVFAEEILVDELAVMEAPSELIDRLHALKAKSGYLITFRDHGIGVPDKFVKRMFKPGNRANHPDVLSKTGAGLGLSVVRAIMRDHYGDVWLERKRNPTELVLFFPDILQSRQYQQFDSWRGNV